MLKTELILKFNFEASHSLFGYEVEHPHLWKLEMAITGTPIRGWLIDLIVLQKRVDELLQDVRGTFLNENEKTNQTVRDFPTCESLSPFFFEKIQGILKTEFKEQNPTLSMSYVVVSIFTPEGEELGAVRVTPC